MFDILHPGLTPAAIPTAITSLLMLLFGGSVLRARVSRVSLAFFALSLAASVWLATFSLMYSTSDSVKALWWAHAAYLGVPT